MLISVIIVPLQAFRGYDDNPSWLAVRNLHDIQLDLSKEPTYANGKVADDTSSSQNPTGPVAHIQCVHIPVHYGTILDTIPRLHGSKEPFSPQAERWFDDRCDSTGLAGHKDKCYPDGYRIEHPKEGFDVIIHVGVGRAGGIRVETLGHKIGYKHGDTQEDLAPELPLTTLAQDLENGSVPVEYDPSVANDELVQDGKLRGFGEGYEAFKLEEMTDVDVSRVVEWLKERGMSVSYHSSYRIFFPNWFNCFRLGL